MAKKKKGEVVNSSALTEVNKFLKSYKKGALDHVVSFSPDLVDKARPSIPVGNVKIEYLIGGPFNSDGENRCGGFPRAAITQVYGKEHCGKTSLCLHAAAQACAMGGTVLYVDYEHILDMRYAKYLGVPVDDVNRFMLVQPTTLEEGVAISLAAIKMGVDLVVYDSVGVALPKGKKLSEKDIAEGSTGAMGLVARAWSEFLPLLQQKLAEFKNTALVAVSQTRANLKGFKDTVQGGRAWKFASAVRLDMRPIGTEKAKVFDPATNSNKDTKVATHVKITVDKNKIAGTQHWDTVVDVMPWRGFDPVTAAVDVLLSHKRIVQGGAWYTYTRPNGEEIKGQGMSNFKDMLREISGIVEELNTLAKPLLKDQTELIPSVAEVSANILEEFEELTDD